MFVNMLFHVPFLLLSDNGPGVNKNLLLKKLVVGYRDRRLLGIKNPKPAIG